MVDARDFHLALTADAQYATRSRCMGKKRGGRRHSHSEEAVEKRRLRRIAVEYERITRTCSCPPWEPHAPDCHERSVLSEEVSWDTKVATCQRFEQEAQPLGPPTPARQLASEKGRASYRVDISESSESEEATLVEPSPDKEPSPEHVVYKNKTQRSRTPPPCCSVKKRKPRHYDEPTPPWRRSSASAVRRSSPSV